MKKIQILIAVMAILPFTASALQPQRGYRGFVDWSNSAKFDMGFLSIENEPGDDTEIFTGISTTHGYQFNNWLYVGGGVGFEYNLDWKAYENEYDENARFIIPVFAEGRLDAKWGRFTPYFSARLGANVAGHGGVYFSPMVGYRFNWGRNSAINLGLGMTLFGYRSGYPEHIMQPGGGIDLGPTIHYQAHVVRFSLRLGYEFQLPM
ncbi:MAG: hypothetical protein K2N16_01555 [Muribaculaceae bacterium]|nr:hypothetical protein [Muribaculaceae bacterium]